MQLMDSKAAELERLLSQLSDVNDGMRNALGGRNDTRAHTLTRHRDILHDYQQVCTYTRVLANAVGLDSSAAFIHLWQSCSLHYMKSCCRSSGGITVVWEHHETGCSCCVAAQTRAPCWVVRVIMHQGHFCESEDRYLGQMRR